MANHLRTLCLLLVVSVCALAACSKKGPEPISFGSDNCANCGMIASDPKFGGELITPKGKIVKFDSVECLAGFLNKNANGAQSASLWVVDFAHPSRLVDATRAFYLQSDKLHSPMGLNLSAISDHEGAVSLQRQYPGTILSWPDVLKYVSRARS